MMTSMAMMVMTRPFLVFRNGTLSVKRVQRPAFAGAAAAEAEAVVVAATGLYSVDSAIALRLVALDDIDWILEW